MLRLQVEIQANHSSNSNSMDHHSCRNAQTTGRDTGLATTSTRVALTAAIAVTDGTLLPTSSQGEGAAVDAAAVAAETAVVATSRRLLSTDLRTSCPRFFFLVNLSLLSCVYIVIFYLCKKHKTLIGTCDLPSFYMLL